MKKEFLITLNGKEYRVLAELLDDGGSAPAVSSGRTRSRGMSARAAAPAPAAAPKASPAAADGDVPSPLAGKVVSIDAAPGTAVEAGDTVITLEAMKMNTVVAAPAAGTVSAVHVQPGDAVEEGQALLTIS